MTLITCSDLDIKAIRLFDTFRATGNTDKILWLIADEKGEIHPEDKSNLCKYFGNMFTYSQKVDDDYWMSKECLNKARWDTFYVASLDINDNETVLIVDTYDVLFQKKLKKETNIPNDVIYCADENIRHADSYWCMGMWSGDYRSMYANERVFNNGVLKMNGRTFKKISRLMMLADAEDIRCDQHLFQHVCYTNGIKLVNDEEICAMLQDESYTIEDKTVKKNGRVPEIIHFCGMKNNYRLETQFENIFPYSRCTEIENNINGH